MKLFISQPMRDKTDDEIKAERKKAIENTAKVLNVSIDEIEIIDSFFEGAPAQAKPLWFLGESLKKLADADVAYFCKDYENYRGCRIEDNCAQEYGIPTIIHVINNGTPEGEVEIISD